MDQRTAGINPKRPLTTIDQYRTPTSPSEAWTPSPEASVSEERRRASYLLPLYYLPAMNRRTKDMLSKVVPGKILQYYHLRREHNIAIIIDELQLIYIPIRKVANRSIKSCLIKETDIVIERNPHNADWKKIPLPEVKDRKYFSFAFVRNPLDRLVSCYTHKFGMRNAKKLFWQYGKMIWPEMSFREFAEFVIKTSDKISDNHFRSQHPFVIVDGENVADFIGKFENFSEDWQVLSDKFGVKPLPHTNKSSRKPWPEYYDKELARKVAGRYAKDIELFDYSDEINQVIDILPEERKSPVALEAGRE